jgi:hypothetical protein
MDTKEVIARLQKVTSTTEKEWDRMKRGKIIIGGDLYSKKEMMAGKDLDLNGEKELVILPKNFRIPGELNLDNANIPSLPEGLSIGGNLYVGGSKLKTLPKDLKVKGIIGVESMKQLKNVPAHLKDKVKVSYEGDY